MKTNLNATIKTRDHDGYKAQTVKELVWGLKAEQGEFIECMTADGPSDDCQYYIVLTNWFTGSVYRLASPIRGRIRSMYEEEFGDVTWYENSRTRAESLIEAMKAKGEVDLNLWIKVE